MKSELRSKMTHFFKTLIIGFLSILMVSCGNLLSDEELQERFQKAAVAKNWKASKDLLDEYLERRPDDIEAYFTRARITTNVIPLDLKSIIADLNTYIENFPGSSVAIMYRFQAYLHANEFENALTDIETIIQKHGKNPFLLSWKGNSAFLAKKFNVAAKVYEQRTRMQGTYEDIRNNYYYMVFSKHLGGNKDGALWDTAFLEDRGFKADSLLMHALIDDKVKFEELANFELPNLTLEELENVIKNECHELDLFDDRGQFRIEILNEIAREPRTEDLEALLPKKEEVYILNLSYNAYKELPKVLFKFKNLQTLNLSGNQFTDPEKTIQELSQLPNLRVLQLNRCNMKKLPESIALLDQLLMLELNWNNLKSLPNAIGELRQLKYLDLGQNLKLTSLPDAFENLKCLQVLDVSQTRLKNFPAVVGYCSQLVKLSASRSKIETLPETLGNLINLRSLSMHYNKIEKLPESIGNLEALRSLDLVSNRLKSLPKSFRKLNNLSSVFLDKNNFETFPEELELLKNVYNIHLSDTPIKSIPYSIAENPALDRIIVNSRYITQKNIDSLKAINPELYVIPQR